MTFRLLSATAFTGAVLAFALPFGAVSSCDGEEVRFTGVELVTQSVPSDPATRGELHSSVGRRAGIFALVAAVASALGAALSVLGRSGTGWCAAVGLAALQFTGYAIVTTSDSGDLYRGFWLALGSLAVAGILALAYALDVRLQEERSIRPPLALALAVVLPPLGLALVSVLWLLSVAVRGLRGIHAERYV